MRLTCLLPQEFEPTIDHACRERVDFIPYRTLHDAWNLAEKQSISLFVSHPADDFRSVVGFLGALQVLCPDAVHIHVYKNRPAEELIALVNKSGVVRLLPSEQFETRFGAVCADAVTAFDRSARHLNEIARLREENEQFEFMLRQSLLS